MAYRSNLRPAVSRGLTLWLRIAFIDGSNHCASRWIWDYRPPFERIEQGAPM